MNLLIVDDTPTNLKLLRAQLEAEGHAVFEAHDGVDALALLERQPVDAVISDILMPRMDGYRLCYEIRKHARLRDLPIILCTSSYTSPDDEKLALHVGADKYLKSPVSVETLVAALSEVIAMPHAAPRAEALGEVEVLKEYSERLVNKLEERNTELMTAEVKFRSLVEQSIVGIYIAQDDQIVYVNPRMAGIFGRSEEEMTSRTFYDFIVPEDHALARENIRKRISGGVPSSHYYLRMLHQSGAVLQIEVHGSQTDYNGRPAVMGTLLDITERKQAEEALAARADQQAVVAELGRLALAGADLQQLFDQGMTRVAETLGTEYCKVLELLPDGSALKLVAGVGWKEGLVGQATVDADRNSQAGFTLLSRHTVIVEDLRTETRFNGLPLLRDHGIVSGLSVIIGEVEEPFGVMGAHSTRRRVFTSDDVNFFQSVAHVLAEAIQRKRAEEQLLLQSTAVEAAGNAILVTNRSGAILLVNPAFTALTGYTAEEVLGKTPRVLKSGKHDQAFYRKLWKTILSGQTWRGEFTNRRKDGSLFYDEHTITPVRSEGGEITHFIGIMHDVTERRQAEEALRLFRTLVDQFNDTFEVIDPETARFLDVNENGCTELGYSRAEYLALRVFDIDPMIKPSAWPQLVEKMRATGSLSGEGFHRRKDGTTFPIEFNAKWVRLDRDYVVTVARDITERKRAEARVREQAEMLDHAHDAIIVRDIHTGPITFWNQGAERLYGWTAAEAVGRDIGKLIFADPSAPKAVTEQLLKTGEWHGEHKHVSKAGEKLTVSSHATLVRDADGHPKSALVINIDITEQKKVEEQFLRAQRLESIGTLASGVAHDLNNILVPILMAAPLLRGDVPEEEREKFLAIVEQSAQRGASIVKQVLTFARGADGDRVLLQPIYLIQEIAKIAERTFPKSITVLTRYPENLRFLEADATQLHQVLLNLAINARDAMPTGGTLTLALENFDVDDHYASMTPGAKAGPHVLLEVSDTGTGIPREIIDKIFDPFFTTKELGQGTGLGLSTVIGLVKSHGGFMEVDSKVGRGTSFKVFLPANISELAAAPTSEAASLPPANGELLLIVDDEKSILQVAKAVLEDHGYRVLTAADATEALAIFALRMNEIDLVLTDLAMPFMDGIALIRTLQKMKPDVRIIASTGRGGREQHAHALAGLNVRACLAKPYNKDKLLTTLHDALSLQTDKQ